MHRNNGAADLWLTLTVGQTNLGPTIAELCTVCAPFTVNTDLSYATTTSDDAVLSGGTMSFDDTEDRIIMHDVTSTRIGLTSCEEPRADFGM